MAEQGLTYTYHDPCELGRGCGIYDEPRQVVSRMGRLTEVSQNREHAYCCGSSLANNSIGDRQQHVIGISLEQQFSATGARAVVTACPLCKKSIGRHSSVEVLDISELVSRGLLPNDGADKSIANHVSVRGRERVSANQV